MAFTEKGVAMLSTVLNRNRATQENIRTMPTFGGIRQVLAGHKELEKKLEAMEGKHDEQCRIVFEAIKQLLTEEKKPKKKIGF